MSFEAKMTEEDRVLADFLFTNLEEVALAGRRCPTKDELRELFNEKGYSNPALSLAHLVEEGRVRIEVCGRNWRVVEILSGPNTGVRTAPTPHGGAPYRVIQKGSPKKKLKKRYSPGSEFLRGKAQDV